VYRAVILPVVLYGYETWSLALKEEHCLRIFEKMVLIKIFGPKRDEIIHGRRKLLNKELHNLYFPLNMIRKFKTRKIRWTGHVARMRRTVLVGKPE
jgi:hypothetical protein